LTLTIGTLSGSTERLKSDTGATARGALRIRRRGQAARVRHNPTTAGSGGFADRAGRIEDHRTIPLDKGVSMTASGIIMAIVIGAIIGALARFVLPGRQNIGILLTIVIGIVAALLGTWLAQLVGVAVTDGIDWIEIVFQVGLAAIAIALFAGVGSRRSV
jgi:uncharacterized membrane protein YeaQ/YmgE (transglycosylase-associated protein family)